MKTKLLQLLSLSLICASINANADTLTKSEIKFVKNRLETLQKQSKVKLDRLLVQINTLSNDLVQVKDSFNRTEVDMLKFSITKKDNKGNTIRVFPFRELIDKGNETAFICEQIMTITSEAAYTNGVFNTLIKSTFAKYSLPGEDDIDFLRERFLKEYKMLQTSQAEDIKVQEEVNTEQQKVMDDIQVRSNNLSNNLSQQLESLRTQFFETAAKAGIRQTSIKRSAVIDLVCHNINLYDKQYRNTGYRIEERNHALHEKQRLQKLCNTLREIDVRMEALENNLETFRENSYSSIQAVNAESMARKKVDEYTLKKNRDSERKQLAQRYIDLLKYRTVGRISEKLDTLNEQIGQLSTQSSAAAKFIIMFDSLDEDTQHQIYDTLKSQQDADIQNLIQQL